MKTKITILIFLISVSTLQSQKKQEIIFKDTLIFGFNLKKDLVLFEDNGKEKIYYRIEETENKSLTNFFILERISKVNANQKIIMFKEFLKRKENYINDRFDYTSFENKFRSNVIIFIDSECLRKKYYKVTPILIVK